MSHRVLVLFTRLFRWRYILIWVLICFLVGGSVIFVLMPRTVTLSSDIRVISIVNVTKTDNATRTVH